MLHYYLLQEIFKTISSVLIYSAAQSLRNEFLCVLSSNDPYTFRTPCFVTSQKCPHFGWNIRIADAVADISNSRCTDVRTRCECWTLHPLANPIELCDGWLAWWKLRCLKELQQTLTHFSSWHSSCCGNCSSCDTTPAPYVRQHQQKLVLAQLTQSAPATSCHLKLQRKPQFNPNWDRLRHLMFLAPRCDPRTSAALVEYYCSIVDCIQCFFSIWGSSLACWNVLWYVQLVLCTIGAYIHDFDVD